MPKAFDSNFLKHINWRTRFYSNSDALIINPNTHIWYFSDKTVDGFPNLKCCDFWVSGICHRWREQDWETRPCQGEEWGRWQNCICICIFIFICISVFAWKLYFSSFEFVICICNLYLVSYLSFHLSTIGDMFTWHCLVISLVCSVYLYLYLYLYL